MTASELAGKIDGIVEGDGSVELTGLSGIREAGSGDLTFLANPRYTAAVTFTRASAMVVARDWQGECPCCVIRVDNPDKAFSIAASLLAPPSQGAPEGIHPTAVVSENARIGKDVGIGPHCVLESGVEVRDGTTLWAGCYIGRETVIGSECRLYPHVTVRERTVIGNRVTVHNGAVIGSDGFGYYRDGAAWRKIPQTGIVEIGDDVEIGANVTIDRARFGKTVIGNGTKIDNLVQVAHNVRIGENTAIAAQAGISGSATIGNGVQVGGQAGMVGHIVVNDNAIVGGKSGVTKDVPGGVFVSGFPAVEHNRHMKAQAGLMRVPDLIRRIAALEKKIDGPERRDGKGRQ